MGLLVEGGSKSLACRRPRLSSQHGCLQLRKPGCNRFQYRRLGAIAVLVDPLYRRHWDTLRHPSPKEHLRAQMARSALQEAND